MTDKFTPGPWKVTKPKAGRIQISHSNHGMVGHAPQICAMWNSKGVTEANAALIAAAPELLQALENYVNGCSIGIDAAAQARAAIAKARGL